MFLLFRVPGPLEDVGALPEPAHPFHDVLASKIYVRRPTAPRRLNADGLEAYAIWASPLHT